MSPTAVPTRITIDFRDALEPSRTWILGLDQADGRVDLLGSASHATPSRSLSPIVRHSRAPSALSAACTCPEFCERDHANE